MSRASLSPRVEQLIDRLEIGLFLVGARLGDASLERGRQLLQSFLGRGHVYLRPQRMVVAHGLAPVGHREAGSSCCAF